MGLLTPSRRVYHRWRTVLHLYDGKECPDCAAVICGREGRRTHRERHMYEREWQEWVADTLMRIARHVGIPTIDPQAQGEQLAGGDGYDRVDLRTPEYDDDDLDEEDEPYE